MVSVILAPILPRRKLRPGEFVPCRRSHTQEGVPQDGSPGGPLCSPGPAPLRAALTAAPAEPPWQGLPPSRQGAGRGELFGFGGPSIKSQQMHRKGSSLSVCLRPGKGTAKEQVSRGCSPSTPLALAGSPETKSAGSPRARTLLCALCTLPPPRKVARSPFQGSDPELTFKVNLVLKVSLLRQTLKYLWLK